MFIYGAQLAGGQPVRLKTWFIEAIRHHGLDLVLAFDRHIFWFACNDIHEVLNDELDVGKVPGQCDADSIPTTADVRDRPSHRFDRGPDPSPDEGIGGFPCCKTS